MSLSLFFWTPKDCKLSQLGPGTRSPREGWEHMDGPRGPWWRSTRRFQALVLGSGRVIWLSATTAYSLLSALYFYRWYLRVWGGMGPTKLRHMDSFTTVFNNHQENFIQIIVWICILFTKLSSYV